MNGEAPYARPVRSQRLIDNNVSDGSRLDSMLGSLQSDLSKHGITTIPKGDCAACNKSIVGQVRLFWLFSGLSVRQGGSVSQTVHCPLKCLLASCWLISDEHVFSGGYRTGQDVASGTLLLFAMWRGIGSSKLFRTFWASLLRKRLSQLVFAALRILQWADQRRKLIDFAHDCLILTALPLYRNA